jgi:hypothetical protein
MAHLLIRRWPAGGEPIERSGRGSRQKREASTVTVAGHADLDLATASGMRHPSRHDQSRPAPRVNRKAAAVPIQRGTAATPVEAKHRPAQRTVELSHHATLIIMIFICIL